MPYDVLGDLTVDGERLLPRGLGWGDIGRDGLALFTQDSGGMVLSLR